MARIESEDAKRIEEESRHQEDGDKDIEVVDLAVSATIMHLIVETKVIARKDSRLGKKILINISYNSLKMNFFFF